MNFAILFYFFVAGAAAGAQVATDQVAVARCRSQCITAVSADSPGVLNDAVCKLSMDCYICWDHCNNLAHDWDKWSALCRDEVDFCRQNPGCGHACRIMSAMPPLARHRAPVESLPAPRMTYKERSKDLKLTWRVPSSFRRTASVPVFWVFFREAKEPWRTLLQTLNTSLQFSVVREPQVYSFCIALIDRTGPVAQTPIVTLSSDNTVRVLQDRFQIDGSLPSAQPADEESLEAEWRRLLGGVSLLSKRLGQLPNKTASSEASRKDAMLPLILGVSSSVVGVLIICLVVVTCYFHRNQSQQLEDMRSSFQAWSSRLGSSFRSSVHLARHSLKRRSARSSSTVVGSTDSGVVLTSGHIYNQTIPEV